MIQRKQTLWLLAACIFAALMLFLPLLRIVTYTDNMVLTAFGIHAAPASGAGKVLLAPTAWLGVLLAVAAALPLVTIFLYKNLLLQLRMCIVEIVLLVGSMAMLGLYAYRIYQSMKGINVAEYVLGYTVADLFPVLGLFCVWMAMRGIVHDQRLLKSLNRIR